MTVQAYVPPSQQAYGWALTARERDIELWRRVVADVFGGWGAPAEVVDLARLGVSELLTNVVRHVEDPHCYLQVAREAGQAVVLVIDTSRRMPRSEEPDWESATGRGLWLLREMAGEFGVQTLPFRRGKAVWFACDLGEVVK
ncbi:ATP-binding protein [Streptomyces avicenniae]|uniref:ATP-binding protein n=1 Tax=Streptomyces avicenniae TaxID=500153 RepID=UPI000DA5F1E4|nr:ATP-binding protein [Streptomyces avicenniae]